MDLVDLYNNDIVNLMLKKVKKCIVEEYLWEKIVDEYEMLFLKN